jgi:predicted nuclease with RNAse H fold
LVYMGQSEVVKCRYLADTNFVIDLANNEPRALAFARENRGEICVSRLVFYELEVSIDDPKELAKARRMLRSTLRNHGITVLELTRDRFKALVKEAFKVLQSLGVNVSEVSFNTIRDTIFALIAKEMHADFVTGDLAACRRAIRLGVCCIYTRSENWTPRCS